MAAILNTEIAVGYEKVALRASTVGDPIIPSIGCLNAGRFNVTDVGAVELFYLPGKKGTEIKSAPSDYTVTDVNNKPIFIPMNNYYDHATKIFKAQANSVPYDMGADALADEFEEQNRKFGEAQLACLIQEGTRSAATAISQANLKEVVLTDVATIRKTGAEPSIAVCSPTFWAQLVLSAGDSLEMDEVNSRLINAAIGKYLGVYWISSPLLAAGMKYFDHTGAAKTVDGSGVNYIMWDGSKFAAVSRINEAGINQGSTFAGWFAAVSSQLGVRVIEPTAVLVHPGE